MLSTGEKSIIFLLNYHGKKASKLRLVKLMFLISLREYIYDFIPYKYGPFSFKLYHDLNSLEQKGIISIKDDDIYLLSQDIPTIDNRRKNIIRIHAQKFAEMNDKVLLDYIYTNYPKYTIFSLYFKNATYVRDSKGITTIGYEGKSIDKFLSELITNKINMLIDVRKNAYSKKFGFNQGILKSYLEKIDIEYIHMPELGIESQLRKDLKNYEDYQNLFANYKVSLDLKKESINKIKYMAMDKKVTLMCFEKDIKSCHRGVIAEVLREDGLEVIDI